jgi:hypothetical protein
MSPRTRSVVAVLVAAVVFAVLTWFDTTVVKQSEADASATFTLGSMLWLYTLGSLAVAAATILFAGLAWWSRSLVAGAVFLLGGAAEVLIQLVPFTGGPWPLNLHLALLWWANLTNGPLRAAYALGAALLVAGVIGLYRWAFTRRLAVVDR